MKRVSSLLAVLLSSVAFATPTPREVVLLDSLIASTQETVATCTDLRQNIVEYLALQDAYVANPSDTASCEKIVAQASHILKRIDENHLRDAFPQDFLNELNTFAVMANTSLSARQ